MTIYVGILYIKSTLSRVESAEASAHFVFFLLEGGCTGVTLLKNILISFPYLG